MTEDPPDTHFDDEPTPSRPPAPRASHRSDNPLEYLLGSPSEDGKRISSACDRGTGAHTPFWMFAELAQRVYRAASWIGRMDGNFRRTRRYVFAAAGFAAVNLGALATWYLHRVEANAAAQEHSAAIERTIREYHDTEEREIQILREDIRELRAAMRKMTDATKPQDLSISSLIPDLIPNKGPVACCARF